MQPLRIELAVFFFMFLSYRILFLQETNMYHTFWKNIIVVYTFEDICPPVYRHIVRALEFVPAPSDSELILESNSESD